MLENLIFDRTQSDVALGTKKGYYNAEDLNRVTAAMEYLVSELLRYGYNTQGYYPVAIPREEFESVLPSGYVQLEYIESTGTQYIDTRISPLNGEKIEVDFKLTNSSSPNAAIFGAIVTPGQFTIRWIGSSIKAFRAISGSSVDFPKSIEPEERHIASLKSTEATIDEYTVNLTSTSSPESVFLFAYNNGTIAANLSSCKIYGVSYLAANGQKKSVFIPCKNPSGSVGMYDIVSDFFFGNDGAGEFIPGEEITEKKPFVWYESDIPTKTQMEQYRKNVASIRAVLEMFQTTPQTPDSMAGLTYQEANDLEKILYDVELVIEQIVRGMARSKCFTFWSGNRPIPCASSDLGRTWAELDAMQTEWKNWQVATWYLLLYGNLEAEGVVS